MKDLSKKKAVLTRRAFFLGGIKALAISSLLGRFYYLQMDKQKQYMVLSDKNRIRTTIIPPIRGLITDCNDHVIVNNNLIYCLTIKQEFVSEALDLIRDLETLLGYQTDISRNGIEKTIKNASYNKLPIIIQNHLSWQDISIIEANIWKLKNKVEVSPTQKRTYSEGKFLGHITGYISKPSIKEAQDSSIPNYREFEIGKNGVEKSFEFFLKGKPGVRNYEADAHGHLIRELSLVAPTKGQKLTLSIDNNIQKIIAEIMEEKVGTVALANIDDGTMAGLYSSPSYDPNDFVGGIKLDKWRKLLQDPDKPLINKAISSAYPPGSTFKIVTALAIIEQGINPEATVFCNGEFILGNRTYHCWHTSGHGPVNWHDAIAKSCNIYFYTYGLKVGIKAIAKIANLLGLGQQTKIELPSEQAGIMPDPSWKVNKLKQGWHVGDTVNSSIGQGFILTTPIQLVNMILRIIHNKPIRPSIIKDNQNTMGLLSEEGQNSKNSALPIKAKHLEMLRYNLYRVFNSPGGTGYNSRLENISLAGKTGTAQVISQRKTQNRANLEHGWFIGFAPYEKPKYAISVIIEHGSWGSKSALPVAKEIFTKIVS